MWFPWSLAALASTSVAGIVDSIVAYRYRASSPTILWSLGLWKAAGILLLFLTTDVRSAWAPVLLCTGVVYYAGIWLYFLTLRSIDASVVTVSLASQTAILTTISLALGDRFSWFQGAGIACTAASLFFLIRRLPAIGLRESAFLLGLSVIFVPDVVAKKLAIAGGETNSAVLFWSLVSTTILSLAVPLLLPRLRGELLQTMRRTHGSFWMFCGLLVVLLFFTLFANLRAYATGPLALIAAVDTVRPFTILLFAWCVAVLKPAWAPRESFEPGAVRVKIAGFALAFVGLLLLAPWQL